MKPTTVPDAGSFTLQNGVAVFAFSGNGHNTFPTWKMNRIAEVLETFDHGTADAIVLTAGDERSFGVGGDFNEVSTFTGSDEVDAWIAACVRMYTAVLQVELPVVAAIGGYAIGIGLQLALCADYRIASPTADLRMPELELGIACVLGACLLRARVAPHVANRMMITCEPATATSALDTGLIDAIAAPGASLTESAVDIAGRFGSFQSVPYATTKRYANASIVESLRHAQIEATRAHRAGFAASQEAQSRMRQIVGGKS